MAKNLLFAVSLVFVVGTAFSAPQKTGPSQTVSDWMTGGSKPSLGLIDPSRLSVDYTIGFGAAFGGGVSSLNSLFAGRFTYRLSDPATLRFVLGFQNTRFGGSPYGSNANSLLGGFEFDYHPTGSLHLSLRMFRAPVSYRPAFDTSSPLEPFPER